jgi:hypothetical protein
MGGQRGVQLRDSAFRQGAEVFQKQSTMPQRNRWKSTQNQRDSEAVGWGCGAMTITITIEDAAANLAVTLKNLISEGFAVTDEYGYEHHAIDRVQQNRAHEALAAYNLTVKGSL